REAKRETQRKSIAGKLWTDAISGSGELGEPNLHGSAARKIRQRAEHAERVAEAEALRATARAYLTKRGLDAEWLMSQVRVMRPHANYDASEIKAGASAVMLTPMFGKGEVGGAQLTGLQRTYLTASGEKIGRRMLGQAGAWLLHPPEGEAVAIGNHEHVRLVGEGFETTASVVQATRQEGVVGYNAGGMIAWAERFEGSEPVAILADRDKPRIFQDRDVGETGQKAAAKAAALIEARDGTALTLEPPARIADGPKGADWADVLREGGSEGVRQALAEAAASSAADRARIEAKITALDAKSRGALAPRPLGIGNGIEGAGRTQSAAREETPPAHPALIRLYKALGAEDGRGLTEAERENVLAGKRADGKDLDLMAWRNTVTHAQTPISYFDFTFSADKTVSLAWAFAPTEAERNQIALTHKDAVAATMAEIEKVIGQARKGKAGQGGTEPGHIGWITFDHYTARPTLEIAHRGPDGKMETEIVSVKVAGDPQLHTHVAVPNVIVTDAGRIVSLNTLPMHGRIHEWGAIYQAHLAQNLRKMGADVVLDAETGAARLTAVPDEVRAAFSKRTRDALADARAYAASVGADWEHLSPDERIKLLKGGACASRTAKADDLSDFASWKRQLEAKGYLHQSVLGEETAKPVSEGDRLDRAYEAAAGVLAKQFEGRAVLKESDERVAAARGLVAAGIKDERDVDRVIARLRERGVPETGDDRSNVRRTKIIAVEAPSGDQESLNREEITATRLTTRAHLAQESALVELAKNAGRDRRGMLSPAEVERGIAASGLTFKGEHGIAQRRLLSHLGKSGRFAVGIGAAGAGKTTLLKPLVAAWHAQGADIHGISLGWRQARELRLAGLDTGDSIDSKGRGAWAPRPNGKEKARPQEGDTGRLGGAGHGAEGVMDAQSRDAHASRLNGKASMQGAASEGRDTVAAVSVFISRAKSGRLPLSSKSVVVLDELG
ncbi:MAG: MobF family relaxase, partial [Acetobacteraceae bacterium]